MNSNKHTELPWSHKPCVSGGELLIRPTKMQGSLQIVPSEDAAFIVKACNNHYQLLKLLTTAYDLVAESIADTRQYDYKARAKSLVIQAQQAIKQAEVDNHD